MRIITTGGDALRESSEELLQAQFKEFGIELKIDNRPGSDVFDVIFGREEDGRTMGHCAVRMGRHRDPGDQYRPGLRRRARATTPALREPGDRPRCSGRRSASSTRPSAIELLNEIDKMLWTDLPDIPLYQKPTYLAYDDNFVNIVDNTTIAKG